jgi:hypothetical protein
MIKRQPLNSRRTNSYKFRAHCRELSDKRSQPPRTLDGKVLIIFELFIVIVAALGAYATYTLPPYYEAPNNCVTIAPDVWYCDDGQTYNREGVIVVDR